MSLILLTGGAGYIGSHTAIELLACGHDVLLLDNFSNSSQRVLGRLKKIVGRPVDCVRADVRDATELERIFSNHAVDAVIHFAALKSVGESCAAPLDYFDNNIGGTISLLRAMRVVGINRLVFSSSATVYGHPECCPVSENAPLSVTNPYGRTKLVMEELIADVCASHADFNAAVLRYFNPVGSHESGLIGENPVGIPNNLMPYICQVAVGRREYLNVFGGDYPTRDGTGVRDYIHVVDLARAHVAAVERLLRLPESVTVNLGTGCGYTVLELVHAFTQASGKPIPYRIVERRAGDVAECFADSGLASEILGWKAEFDLERMCVDAWRWQSRFPRGYDD